MLIGGFEQVVKVAHLRLCHSRAFLAVAYPRESQEMVSMPMPRPLRISAASRGAGSPDFVPGDKSGLD